MKMAMCSGNSRAAMKVVTSTPASAGVLRKQMRSSFLSYRETALASTKAASTLCGMQEMSGKLASINTMPRHSRPQKTPEKRVAAPEL